MVLHKHVDGLGVRLEGCITDAVLAWRDEHARSERIEDLMAEAVTSVTCEVTLWRGGRATVIVMVRGRMQYDDETHVFRLIRKRSDKWDMVGSSLTL